MNLEKMLEEEKELENAMFGTNDDPSESEAVIEAVEEPTQVEEPETIPKTEPKQSPEQKHDWKKRHINYKASTDATISDLRRENARLSSQNAELMRRTDELSQKIASMQTKVDVFDNVVTQEDRDIIGTEAIDISQKIATRATEAAVAPLEAEIKRLRAQEQEHLKQQAEAQYRKNYEDRFLAPLERAVPDYMEIDSDPKFIKYLEGIDEVTGMQRMELFRIAEKNHDAGRVAGFFIDFKNSKKAVNPLEKKVTPVSKGNSDADSLREPSKKRFSIKEYEQYYNDYERGVYRGREKEWKIIEAKLDKAYLEGNIY